MSIKKYRTSIFLALYFIVLLSTFWYMPQLAFIIFISLLLQLLLLLLPHLIMYQTLLRML